MSTINLAILNRILDQECEMRFQDPKIEKHGTSKMFWRIRPYVPVVQDDGAIVRKQVPIVLGYCDEMTQSEAKKKKQEVMATINAGKVTVQAQISFGALLDKYETGRIPLLSSSTQEKYKNHIRNHIRPAFGGLKLMEIDRATVQMWMTSKLDKISWATRCDLRSIMAAIFKQAAEWKLWDGDNPAHKISVGRKRDAREKKILTEAEFARFIQAIPDTCLMSAEKAKLAVMIAVIGGLRVSEVLGLQAGDVDYERGVVRVSRRWHRGNVDKTKTEESSAEVEVTKPIAARLVGDGWIFGRPDTGEPPDDRDLQQHVFRPAAKATGLYFEGFGMHTFRRMKITWSQRAGASALEAALLARHSNPKTTMRYTVMDDQRRSEITDAVARKVM